MERKTTVTHDQRQRGAQGPAKLGSFGQRPYDPQRFAAMLLGLAIGDSLGNTSEGMTADQRADAFGWIAEYQPNKHVYGIDLGLPSDDTQQSFWLVEQLLLNRVFEPHKLAARFADETIFGIGQNTRTLKSNLADGMAWFEAGGTGLGNGAMMRAAPMLMLIGQLPPQDVLSAAAACARITHRDPLAIASALAWLHLLDYALQYPNANGTALASTYLHALRQFEPKTPHALRGGLFLGAWSGLLSEFIEKTVLSGNYADMSVVQFGEVTHSGAFLFETVPTLLFILMRHDGDPERGILEAVNSTVDNDTIASLVATAFGAQHGSAIFRRSWITNLSGRTSFDDDGRVQALLGDVTETMGRIG